MFRVIFFVVASIGAAPVYATQPETRHHGAHVHGAAQLNVAWDGNAVTVEFETPAMNIVGFEHEPRTPAQKNMVRDALAALKKPDTLFLFTPAARCRSRSIKVDTDHAEKHRHASGTHGDEHSEFHAEYQFVCEASDALRTVDVRLFRQFPKTERLRAQIVTPHGQRVAELTPENTRLTLR